jgi:hypothetical protein
MESRLQPAQPPESQRASDTSQLAHTADATPAEAGIPYTRLRANHFILFAFY